MEDALNAGIRASLTFARSAVTKDHRGKKMGQVAITFEIMPDGIETDLNDIKDTIQSDIGELCDVQHTEEKPIAFGLKALLMNVIVEDEEGIMDKLEDTIGSVPGVQNAKVVSLTKL